MRSIHSSGDPPHVRGLVLVAGAAAALTLSCEERVAAPLGVEAVLDAELPAPLPPTWQARFGSLSAAMLLLGFLVASVVGKRSESG